MKKLIVTNNPMVRERYSQQYDLKYEETSFVGVLKQVRDLVHRGYRLLKHPL
ncbi:MAG: GrdX protein, partial [Lachnoanaerobaculum sp.]